MVAVELEGEPEFEQAVRSAPEMAMPSRALEHRRRRNGSMFRDSSYEGFRRY